MSERTCTICGQALSGRRRATCSDECKAEAARRRAAAWYAERRGDANLRARVASARAAYRKRLRNDPERLAAYYATSAANRRNARERHREQERRWRHANPDRARQKVLDRRARVAGAFVETVDLAVIWDRDRGICGICREPIDPALIWPHRRSKTLDHVIPLAAGGTHEPANAQLAHASCNSSKGARIAV